MSSTTWSSLNTLCPILWFWALRQRNQRRRELRRESDFIVVLHSPWRYMVWGKLRGKWQSCKAFTELRSGARGQAGAWCTRLLQLRRVLCRVSAKGFCTWGLVSPSPLLSYIPCAKENVWEWKWWCNLAVEESLGNRSAYERWLKKQNWRHHPLLPLTIARIAPAKQDHNPCTMKVHQLSLSEKKSSKACGGHGLRVTPSSAVTSVVA